MAKYRVGIIGGGSRLSPDGRSKWSMTYQDGRGRKDTSPLAGSDAHLPTESSEEVWR